MRIDLRPLAARVHALHVEYVVNFGVAKEEESEATHRELLPLLARLESLAADWPEATDAILDAAHGQRLDDRYDIEDIHWARLRDDHQTAFADLGLELDLPNAREYFDRTRKKIALNVRRPPRAVPTDLGGAIDGAVRSLTESVAALGEEPWSIDEAGIAPELRMYESAAAIRDVLQWIEPSDRLIRLGRATRSIRRLRHLHLSQLSLGWACVRRAVARLST